MHRLVKSVITIVIHTALLDSSILFHMQQGFCKLHAFAYRALHNTRDLCQLNQHQMYAVRQYFHSTRFPFTSAHIRASMHAYVHMTLHSLGAQTHIHIHTHSSHRCRRCFHSNYTFSLMLCVLLEIISAERIWIKSRTMRKIAPEMV